MTMEPEQQTSNNECGPKGWCSPSYTTSRKARLDPDRLRRNRCVGLFSDAPEIDAYKVLRTQIQHLTRTRGWNTIMITSVNPAEGKSLTAVNLALTLAKEFDQTVLLVDADMRVQRIRHILGFQSDYGLADYLLDDRPLSDLIVWPGIEKMTLISGGRTIQDSAELLGCQRMHELVQEMKQRYEDRFVLFDVPAVLSGADAIAFAPLVDAILIVVAGGLTDTGDIRRTLELLPRDKILGFVLNHPA